LKRTIGASSALMRQHGGVKRSSAIRHVVEMCAEATDCLTMRETDIGWPLEELWVTGELLGTDREVDSGSVILRLDVPPDELPWLALHPGAEWVGQRLRLGKRPMMWCYRPLPWPAWNVSHRRVVRIWSAAAGLDEAALEALRSCEGLDVIEPTDDELRTQLVDERAVSHAHLHRIVDDYEEPEFRRRHRGGQAEDHLWRAAAGLLDIDDGLAALGNP